MKIESYGKTYDVVVKRSAYHHGGGLAVILETVEGEPYCTLTVNLEHPLQNERRAFINVNSCPWAEKFLSEYDLATPLGLAAESGFCVYPLYQFDLDLIPEII